MTAASLINAADVFPIVQGGANKKATASLFRSLLFSQISTPAAITATTETNFGLATSSYTVPANQAVVNDVYTVKLAGHYSGTVLPTITGKIYFGTQQIADTGAITGLVTGSLLGWRSETRVTIRALGGTGTLSAESFLSFSTAATAALSVFVRSGEYTIDFTTTNLIKITIQWGAGGTAQTITLTDMTITRESL